MRDMCQRHPTWTCISDWLLELIVEKCFFHNRYVDVTMKLRAVFECISSGILFLPVMSIQYESSMVAPKSSAATTTTTTDNVVDMKEVGGTVDHRPEDTEIKMDDITLGLTDPCAEIKSDANIFEAHLSVQQREELTVLAQSFLRMISLRRAHEVLAMDVIKMAPSKPRVFNNNRNVSVNENGNINGFENNSNSKKRHRNVYNNRRGKNDIGAVGGGVEAPSGDAGIEVTMDVNEEQAVSELV